MGRLKKKIAALGFVCFFSLALLPVSMSVCGPFTANLLRHAKKVRHVKPDPSPQFRQYQPDRSAFERDMIAEESDPVRDPLQHAWAAGNPTELQRQTAEGYLAHGLIRSAKVSTHIFQSVLNL